MFFYSLSALVVLFLTRHSRAQCENDAVGIEDGRIPDAQLTASSQTATAKNGRLGNHSSWCAAGHDLNPHLQIDLGAKYVICAAATQGKPSSSGDRWVETYQLQSSTDGAVWRNYTMNGLDQVINGNSDPRSAAKRIILAGIYGQYIRFLPREYHGSRCLRVELYGKPVVDPSKVLGVANKTVFPDYRFSSPSEYSDSYEAFKARLNGPYGWTPKAVDRGTAYLQIDLGTLYIIYAIATQGSGGSDGTGENEWIEMYKLKISLDNSTWPFYNEGTAVQVFKGNVDPTSVVTNILPTKVTAAAIRIVPVTYESYPTLRVELYHVPFPAVDLSKALGVANRDVFPDSRFYSPSEFSGNYKAANARLNGVLGWTPASAAAATAYLQIDLGTVHTIYAIATQGNGGNSGNGDGSEDEWVTTYKLGTSLDRTTWSFYKEGSTDKIFQGNTDMPTVVMNILRVETTAIAIRVKPVTYNNFPTLRVELYGPPLEACSTISVGLANRTAIPDHRFSAPSSMDGKSPYLARLHGAKGWVPESSHKDSAYLEIDLGAAYMVCAIATQGYGGSDNFWVTQYQLKLSMDGDTWLFNKTFTANYDKTSVVKRFIDSPTQSKFIHIKPTTYNTQPALRVEVYGSVRGVMTPFGLEDSVISDLQIRGSSSRDSKHTAKEGRLYNTKAWCAGGNGMDEYLQIDLGGVVTLTGLATQADPSGTGWVKSYDIGYSNDGQEWRNIQTNLVVNKYKGNHNSSAVFASWFSGSLVARFVKILPQAHEKAICVRTEVFGNTFVELPVLRPILQNRTLQKQPNSSVAMTCNIYSPGIVKVVWLLNGSKISDSSAVVTQEPKSTFTSPTVTTLTVVYGNASHAKSRFKCRKVSGMERVLKCPLLAVECRAEVTKGATVSSASFISLYNNLVLPGKTQASTLSFIGASFVNISWPRTDPGDGEITSYSISYRNEKSGENNTIEVTAGIDSVTISTQLTGLQPFTPYMVQIRAVSSIGSGRLSENSSFVTRLAASISVSPSTQSLKFGADETFLPLKCFGQGFPLPKITWKQNGLPLNNTSQLALLTKQLSEINGTSELDLKPGGINIKEAGNYTCEVYNGIDGQGVLSATVQVLFLPMVFILEPGKRAFRRGMKNTTVPCSGRGYPTPNVYWKKDNNTVITAERDQLLNLTNGVVQVQTEASSPLTNISSVLYLRASGLTYSEAGNYTCVVSNGPDVNHSVWMSVEVLFLPEFTSSPSNQVVLEGMNATFNCSANGVPPPSVTWLFSGGNMSSFTFNQESLHLYGVQNTGNFEGNYTCVSESRAGTNIAVARLTVDVAPRMSNHLNNQSIVLGSSFTMFCDVRGDPWPNITWSMHNMTAIQHSNVSSDGRNITVPALGLNQIGIYRCLAENRVGVAMSSAWINIIVVPKVYISSKNGLKLFIGAKNKSVVCHGNGFPDPTIVWKRNGEVIPVVTAITSNDSDRVMQILSSNNIVPLANISSTLYLRFGGITYEEAGNYTCVVEISSELNNTASQSVEVMFVPEFVEKPLNVTALPGNNVTFSCVVTGIPKPTIAWNFSGGVLPRHFVNDDGSLTVVFINNSAKYEGAYTCIASSSAGERSETAWLAVDVSPNVLSTFTNRSLLLTETLNLTCEATGEPHPAITWVKDGVRKSSSSKLIIGNLVIDDIGRYQCIARNRAGNDTADVWVDIQARPSVHVTPPLTRKLTRQRKNISIDCYGNGYPEPSVIWKRSNTVIPVVQEYNVDHATSVVQVITENSSPLQNVTARLFLRTAGVTYNESGNYTCLANNTVQGRESVTERDLEILFKPELLTVPRTTIAQVEHIIRFNCSATGIPTPRVTWTFSNGALPEGYKLVGSDLVIGPVQNEGVYEGVFTCTASSRAGMANASAELIVHVPPRITTRPLSLVAERWSTVNFTCLASGDPPPTYEWSRNGHAEDALRAELHDQNRTLVFRNVTEKDDGTYTCHATNAAGNDEQSANLTVHAGPRIVRELEPNVTVVVGGTVNFTCLGEGIPAPNVTWLWNNKSIVPEGCYDIVTSGNTEKHSMLSVSGVEYKDRGVYTCLITNNRGTARSTARLTVYVATTIIAVPESSRQRIQLPVTLNCSAQGFPLPSIRWKKAGTEISSNHHHVVISTTSSAHFLLVHSGLYIAKVVRNDTENYTCVASNSVNKEERIAKITVLERPDQVTLKLVTKSAWSVSLTWTPTFTGNLPVRWFTVSYNVSQSGRAHNISSDTFRSTVPHLKPATLYTFHVTATNDIGPSEPAVLVVTTSEWLPEYPRNVTATFTNSTSFEVAWTKPEVTNGVLKLYNVYYWPAQENVTSANNVTVFPPHTSAIATNLLPYTNYSSRVQAFTAIGGGNLSEPVIFIQTHEDAPGAPRELEVTNVSPFSITVQWRKPLVLNGVLRGYTVTLANKNGRLPNRNVTTNHLKDIVTFTLSSLEAFTHYSIQVRAFTIEYGDYGNKTSRTTDESEPSEPRDVNAYKSGAQVTVKWKTPNKPNGIILRYTVLFAMEGHTGVDQPESKEFKTENNVTEISFGLDKLNGATTYVITVLGETRAGEGKASTDTATLKTKPSQPPPPPSASTPTGTETTAVLVIPKFSDVNGKITSYRIYVVVFPSNIGQIEVKSINDVDVLSWSSVYEEVDKTGQPAAYIAFEFPGDQYNQYSTFTVGSEEKYPAKRKRRATPKYRNGELKADRKYAIFVRAFVTDEIYADTAAIALQTKPTPKPTTDEPGSTMAIVITVVIVVAILAAIVGFVMYLRRKGRLSRNPSREESIRLKSMQAEAIYDQPVIVEQKLPIPAENLKQHYLRMHADDDFLFKKEYKSIQTPGNPTTVCCDAAANKTKNRYANIKAYDHSRVVLAKKAGVEGSDYINANYIDGYRCKNRYIATIGPKPETENAFWQMVIEQGSSAVVMLTRTVENGKLKCHEYWPENGSKDYDGITVKLMETEELADYEIRTFKLNTPSKPESKPRTVTHFFFTAWPDHDVPNHATSLLEFWRRVKHAIQDNTAPIVVHCSAGVGRTGTFIVIDAMMAQIDAEGEMDIYNFVTHIRGQRIFMVQRESQYVFIHYAILEAITFGNTEIAVQDLRVKLRELNKKDRSTGESEMQRQFKLLDGAVPDENNDFSTALMPENYSKNRQSNVLPLERTRVQLEQEENIEGRDTTYINANFIGGYQLKTAFIAAQTPLKSTVADFWRMVWEQGVCSIVMLARDDEPLKIPLVQYWPLKGSNLCGNINVELGQQIPHKGFTERRISITNTKVGEVRRVRQYQYTEWPPAARPANPSSVIDLIGCVQKLQMQTGNKPIVVHCSDGVGRTGAFCCISTSVERIKTEGIIDVFSAARMLRTQRPGMINKLEQYRFCYDAVLAYLDSFEEYQYQNFQ